MPFRYKKIFILFFIICKSSLVFSKGKFTLGSQLGLVNFSPIETKKYGSIAIDGVAFSAELSSSWQMYKYFILDLSLGLNLKKNWNSSGNSFSYKSSISHSYLFLSSYFLRTVILFNKKITPMIGFGFGMSRNTFYEIIIEDKNTSNRLGNIGGNSQIDFAYKLSTLFEYEINPRVSVNIRFDYKNLGGVVSSDEVELTALGKSSIINISKIEATSISVIDISIGGRYQL